MVDNYGYQYEEVAGYVVPVDEYGSQLFGGCFTLITRHRLKTRAILQQRCTFNAKLTISLLALVCLKIS
jgi:hypothetical protein